MSEFDLRKLSRREAIGALGATAAAISVACGKDTPTNPTATRASSATSTATPTGSAACVTTPTETEGPFPNITTPVRSDVREDRTGLPLTLIITVVNINAGCAPVNSANVEIWHCDAQGNYSEYSQPGFDGRARTFLRGLQVSGIDGRVTFTTIYPGWYAGRATHIHIDVDIGGTPVKTTQMAFPEEVNSAVYATGVYAPRGQNPTKNSSDNVFADGVTSELATLSGNSSGGYTATFTVGVSR